MTDSRIDQSTPATTTLTRSRLPPLQSAAMEHFLLARNQNPSNFYDLASWYRLLDLPR
jgi:hypothetical protein